MGNNRPVQVKCWERFLKANNCSYKSTHASHDKWRCPGCIQSIIFRGAEKEIPFAHIATNLLTMKIEKEVFIEWVKVNC